MSFAQLGLSPALVQAVTAAGYTTPTQIQERAIPVALAGRDLIACAQTGTGKTAAFLLPLLQRLAAGQSGRHPRALIVTPTRELAAQVGEMAVRYGRYLRLRSTVLFGGVGMGPQKHRLTQGLDLIVATPGRLLDHLGRGHVTLGRVDTVVLDEADRMLDMGFLPDVRRILGTLASPRQSLFFSATMPKEIEAFIRRASHDPSLVEVTRRGTPAPAIRQVVHMVAPSRKREALRLLLERDGTGPTLVFTRTKARANQLVRYLDTSDRRVAAIHANKSQSARTRALAEFRDGALDTLIATDIAARGIDVDGISHVINFDLPHVPEDYVHRIGRTARAGRAGHALAIATPEDGAKLAAIERLLGQTIRRERVADLSASDPQDRRDLTRPRGPSAGPRRRRSTARTPGSAAPRRRWRKTA